MECNALGENATIMNVTYSESFSFTLGNVTMTLKDYLIQNRLSLKAFADICGVSAPTILRARDGVNMPSRRTLRAIVEATNGEVSIQDLVVTEPRSVNSGAVQPLNGAQQPEQVGRQTHKTGDGS